jgi:intracellular septation protein A
MTNPASVPSFDFKAMLPTLIFDVVLPIILFNVLDHSGFPVLWAVVASGLSPALNNLRLWIKSHRIEPLGIIVITLIAIGAAASLISGSLLFAVIKESFLTGAFGMICLVSLFRERPLLFYINRQFVAADDPVKIAWWNGLWEIPQFRSVMWFVTLVWGIAYVVEAVLRVGLALVLAPALMMNISPVLGFGALILLVVWTRHYMMAFRARRLREQEANV